MVNLKESFEAAALTAGDTLRFAVIGPDDRDSDAWDNWGKECPVEPWEIAGEKINYSYNNGYGGADCHAVIAWGDRFVYYVAEYDGSTYIKRSPRNPEPCAPYWAGVDV